MTQIKFLWLSNNIPGMIQIRQDEYGIVKAKLSDSVDIVHDSTKRDKMTIVFHDTNDTYLIPDQRNLEEIYRIHLENDSKVFLVLAHQYCESYLSKCE